MKIKAFSFLFLLLPLVAALSAQPGIEIEGSGIVGTEVKVHLTGNAGDYYLLYMGLLANPTESWTGQLLGIGPAYFPVSAGRFDSSGRFTFQFPVPDVPELVGKGMAFFQFETFEVKIWPPSFTAKNVSPAAYFVAAAADTGKETLFGVEGTDSVLGSTLNFTFRGQPDDFLLGYYGNIALPVMLEDGTNICVLPPIPFTKLLAMFDKNGTYKDSFIIPEIPALVGTNVCFQFQTFNYVIFPPSVVLKDSSCCLMVTVKAKTL